MYRIIIVYTDGSTYSVRTTNLSRSLAELVDTFEGIAEVRAYKMLVVRDERQLDLLAD